MPTQVSPVPNVALDTNYPATWTPPATNISSITYASGVNSIVVVSAAGIAIGDSIIIAGATASANNGTFTVTGVSGTTVTVANPSGVTQSGAAGTLSASLGIVTEITSFESPVRSTLRQDVVDYTTSQRWEGDLFKRDLILANALNAFMNSIGQRSGLTFSLPTVYLPAGKKLIFGKLPSTIGENSVISVVGIGCNVTTGTTASTDYTIQVINAATSAVVASVDSVTGHAWYAGTTTVTGDVTLAMQVVNAKSDGSFAKLEGYVILQPRL